MAAAGKSNRPETTSLIVLTSLCVIQLEYTLPQPRVGSRGLGVLLRGDRGSLGYKQCHGSFSKMLML